MSFKGWPLRPLGRCAKFLSGGTPSKARPEFWEGDIPWVSSGEMTVIRIHDTPLRITAEAAEAGSRLVPENTVLAVVRGMSLAKEFRVALTRRQVAFNQDLKAFACQPDIDPEFLFYALFARREHIRELATEASHGTKKLETDVLAAVELPVPKPDVQRRTVTVASAYDDLIENNHRRMELLENAARLLYQEWFVRLRLPGHEHTRLTCGIPEGWERKRIGDIADCVGGGTPSTSNPAFWDDGDITWVTPTDVTRNDHFVLLDAGKKITEAGLQNSSAKLVPPHAVLMTSRDSVGFFAMADRTVCTNQGFISIVPKDTVFSTFLLFQLSQRVEEIRAMGSGSTYPEVSRGKFREFEVVVPPRRLAVDFDEQATLLLKQIRVLKQQNEKLRTARDLLLPRLMSGEIAV
jgi:type I restriction enzyme S subunit